MSHHGKEAKVMELGKVSSGTCLGREEVKSGVQFLGTRERTHKGNHHPGLTSQEPEVT